MPTKNLLPKKLDLLTLDSSNPGLIPLKNPLFLVEKHQLHEKCQSAVV